VIDGGLFIERKLSGLGSRCHFGEDLCYAALVGTEGGSNYG